MNAFDRPPTVNSGTASATEMKSLNDVLFHTTRLWRTNNVLVLCQLALQMIDACGDLIRYDAASLWTAGVFPQFIAVHGSLDSPNSSPCEALAPRSQGTLRLNSFEHNEKSILAPSFASSVANIRRNEKVVTLTDVCVLWQPNGGVFLF